MVETAQGRTDGQLGESPKRRPLGKDRTFKIRYGYVYRSSESRVCGRLPHPAMVQQSRDKSGGFAYLVKRQGVRAAERLELLQAVHREV